MSNANEPAYPQTELVGDRGDYQPMQRGGLTKREAFAMAAMQGLLTQTPVAISAALIAKQALIAADALLAELAKAPT